MRELIAGQSRKRELDAEEAIVVKRTNVELQRESLSKSLSSHSCQIDKLMDEIELIKNSTSITIHTDKSLSKNDNLKIRIGYIIKLRITLQYFPYDISFLPQKYIYVYFELHINFSQIYSINISIHLIDFTV